jgi:hypothetical protein
MHTQAVCQKIITFREDSEAHEQQEVEHLILAQNGVILRKFTIFPGISIAYPQPCRDVGSLITTLSNNPAVESVEEDDTFTLPPFDSSGL